MNWTKTFQKMSSDIHHALENITKTSLVLVLKIWIFVIFTNKQVLYSLFTGWNMSFAASKLFYKFSLVITSFCFILMQKLGKMVWKMQSQMLVHTWTLVKHPVKTSETTHQTIIIYPMPVFAAPVYTEGHSHLEAHKTQWK